MAINPQDYTIDYNQLITSTTVRNRMLMAQQDPGFYNQLSQVLTPSQMANLFPRYYRDRLPDISGFELATSQIAAGTFGKRLETAPIGAESGEVVEKDIRSRREIEKSAKKTGQVDEKKLKESLLERGIDVDNIYKILKKSTNLNDPRLATLKDMSPDRLKKLGIEIYQDEVGKNLVRLQPSAPEKMSSDQLIDEMSKTGYGTRAGLNEESKLIDFQSKKLAEELGIDSRQYNAYRQGIADKESSGGNYEIVGGASGLYAGAYQFGEAARIDASKILGVDLPSEEEFLKNPELQEQFMDAYTYANHKTLMKNKKYRDMSPEEKLGMLAYAHNQGGGGALDYLKTGIVGSDKFRTRGTAFTESVKAQLEETKNQTVIEPEDGFTYDQVEEYRKQKILEAEKKTIDDLTAAYAENGLSEDSARESAEQVVLSKTNMLGFAPGEEDVYLGGVSEIDAIPASGTTIGSREFGKVYTDPETGEQYPIRGGAGHAGTDFGAEQGFEVGTPWKAHMPGEVIGGGYSTRGGKGYGYYIDVKFDDGSIHRYAHNDENVAKGKFEKGDTLFKVGASGVESGWAHAHSEVWLPKEINGKQYTADELYSMSAGMLSKTEKGLMYRSNPRDYWQNYEQQQLALREKYEALQERVKENYDVLDDISNEELKLLAERGEELYPYLAESARKKISDEGIEVAEKATEELSTPQAVSVPSDNPEEGAETDPYKDKTVDELQTELLDIINSDDFATNPEKSLKRDAITNAIRDKRVAEDEKAAVDAGLYEGGSFKSKDNLKVVREDGSPTGIRVASDETAVIIPPDERRKAQDIVSLDGTDQRTGLNQTDENMMNTKPIEEPLNKARMATGEYAPSNQSTIPSSLGTFDRSPSAERAYMRDKHFDNHGYHSAPRVLYSQK